MAKTRDTLTEIATRHQVFLERLKTRHAADFAQVFNDINLATRSILAALTVENLGALSKRRLGEMLAELRAVNSAWLLKAETEFFANMEKLAGYEAGFEARTFGFVAASVRLKVPQAADAFADALARPLSVNGDLLKNFVRKWTAGEVDRINNTVRRAWGEGWTINKLTSAVNGTKKLNYADGILGPPGSTGGVARRNARSVVRTAVQHVSSSARMATLEANANVISGYRFVATLDSVTTQVCRSLDGQVFELGTGPVPPLHVNCRSTLVAVVDPALAFLDKGATRSSQSGYVDAKQTYYEWLKTQPAEFQDTAIGKTRGLLFRQGGLSADQFSKLNLGRNFEPLTLAEMQKLEPLAFKRAGISTK